MSNAITTLLEVVPAGGSVVDADGDIWTKDGSGDFTYSNPYGRTVVCDADSFIARYGIRSVPEAQPNLLEGTERFMLAAGQPIADVPGIPSAKSIANRLAMLLEEVGELAQGIGFSGLLDATLAVQDLPRESLEGRIQQFISEGFFDVPDVTDAYNDIIVISQGGALETAGSKGTRLTQAEVTRANDDKVNGKHGPTQWAGEPKKSKVLKPEGWQGPDVVGALTEAGWVVAI
ncbi:hypothetical protein [Rhodococcoides fascians]|uniref:hypothetical protein n=1 Tax=Rhodococcoides fascians TaxID=1828 RepID=UPI00050CE71D|nr:hypothetical protein [Rhodococcus fascians]